ncbi:formate dehydrogenase accessory sulfurtransferase FdhD [Cupriavidus basilensis]|uniref:Formate dehydrogenase accessory sulfurtransferase FdhD n=1 Tax=Cupriavidus basilensis TaxID=68895 RepID=A0ABT6AIS1_9BURK|nr:formate dehydrogenase accessory sulfurtransferase FdhD [Cupriavidus basilensis]MDF3832500.1 formate dehydrogenase accessory sulfurtransferase FdhD [Cupriavidus basilensis]
MSLRPELTQAAAPLIEEIEVVDEQGRARQVFLPGERPLTVYLDKRDGQPFLMSRSGVTQIGYRMAQRVNLTLFARCTGRHFLLYTGCERFRYQAPEQTSA